MAVKVVIGGDIVPSYKNSDYFCNGGEAAIADIECLNLIKNADFRIYNLETPITNVKNPIKKDGRNFSIPTNAISGLQYLLPDVISVANNHCKDQGEAGLLETVECLENNGITVIGYGHSHEDAKDVKLLEKDGTRISVISCAEQEFTIFDRKEIGAIPYHDYWTNYKIAQAKKRSDFVIVLYHGGNEYYQYVAPYLQERCHLMAKNGADVVLCQHSHCIGCFENYGESLILYGQGNFIFHQTNNKPITKEGLLVEITLDEARKTIDFIPVILNESDTVCLAGKTQKDAILSALAERSQNISNGEFVAKEYNKYVRTMVERYLHIFTTGNKLMALGTRVLCKLGISCHSVKSKVKILNILQNEAHRNSVIEALKDDIKREG